MQQGLPLDGRACWLRPQRAGSWVQMDFTAYLSPQQAMSNPFETFAGVPLTSTSPCSTSGLPCKMEDPLASFDVASSGLPSEIWLPELVPEPSGSSVDEEASFLDSLAPSLPTSSPGRSSGGISEQPSITRDTSTPKSCANCSATETPRQVATSCTGSAKLDAHEEPSALLLNAQLYTDPSDALSIQHRPLLCFSCSSSIDKAACSSMKSLVCITTLFMLKQSARHCGFQLLLCTQLAQAVALPHSTHGDGRALLLLGSQLVTHLTFCV